MPLTGANTYQRYPRLLETLPPLVRKQRRLAGKLAPLKPLEADEKQVRSEIDALLLASGFEPGHGVTCAGYDVVHRERKGNTTYDVMVLGELVVQKLVSLGVPLEDLGTPSQGVDGEKGYVPASKDYQPGAKTIVVQWLIEVRSVGETAKFAEVKPMKGAKVRT